MSRDTRADIEALRASDRLQHIFRNDPAPEGIAARRDGGLDPAAEPPARRRRMSRRSRILIGLFPVLLGFAVLAAEEMLSLDEGPAKVTGPAGMAASPVPQAGDDAAPIGADAAADRGQRREEVSAAEPTLARERAAPADPDRPAQAAASEEGASEIVTAQARFDAPLREEPPAGNEAADEAARHSEPEPVVASKSSDELGKAIDLPAAIRRSVAAGRSGRPAARVGDPRQMPSAQAPAEEASAGEIPTDDRSAVEIGAARPRSSPAEEDGSTDAETVAQPRWSAAAQPERVRLPTPGRPEMSADAPIDQPVAQGAALPRVAAPAENATPPQAAEALPQATLAPPRIVVHYSGAAGAADARRLASTLQTRGMPQAELRSVPFEVSRANVRYFHDQNRSAARQVNEVLNAMGRRSDVRDFTHFTPLPSFGTIEIWLPG